MRIDQQSHFGRLTSKYFFRGDQRKNKEELGWILQITLEEMIEEIVAYDLDRAKRHSLLKSNAYVMALTREN